MSRNGPIALVYHTLFVTFMLAPILVVCFVAFTPEAISRSRPTAGRCAGSTPSAAIPSSSRPSGAACGWARLSSAIAVAFSVPAALAIGRIASAAATP
jgi:putative spermidine/putrescine transport system permease protein